jgi:low affinity Fe/Cu permease
MTFAVLGWCGYGVLAGFSREWLLISNIAGTLGALLILLLVQHARSRHTLAIQAKLDELILSSEAKNQWIGAERHPPEIVEQMRLKHHDNTG